MIVDIRQDVTVGSVQQRFFQVFDGSNIVFILIVGQTPSVIDKRIMTISIQSIAKVVDTFLIRV
jgi:hypothetical protein